MQPQWKPPLLKNYSSRSADSLIFTSHGRAALERGAWRLKAVTLLCCIDWERAGVIRLPDSDTWKCRAVILPTTETFIKVCWWNRETRSESEWRKPTCLVCRCHRILDSCRNESWQHFAFSFKSQERQAAVNQRRWTVCFAVHYRRAISCQVEGKTTLELLLFNLSVRLSMTSRVKVKWTFVLLYEQIQIKRDYFIYTSSQNAVLFAHSE